MRRCLPLFSINVGNHKGFEKSEYIGLNNQVGVGIFPLINRRVNLPLAFIISLPNFLRYK